MTDIAVERFGRLPSVQKWAAELTAAARAEAEEARAAAATARMANMD